MPSDAQIRAFLQVLRRHYRAHGRAHLPWRSTRDPYRILVSEIMLQQTQVERVIPFYQNFLKAFPTSEALARAPLAATLSKWQGLGYNRRAKFLRDAARAAAKRGGFPRTAAELEALPGVGPYTARAVAAFAYDAPEIFIETNIRTVFFHHLFQPSILQKARMSDAELLPAVARALKLSRMRPREFYAALMDYGSHLKRRGVRLNSASAHYAKQSKFEGSARQLRGQILKLVLEKPRSAAELARATGRALAEVQSAVAALCKEGLIAARGAKFSLTR